MKDYTITLTRTVGQVATIVVSARNSDEARTQALDAINAVMDWTTDLVVEEATITKVTKA